MKNQNSYVNLKHFGEFNKYTMALSAATFLYFDKFDSGYSVLRTLGVVFSAVAVVIGVIAMSALGRIQGDDIDYEQEKDENKVFLFKVISRALSTELMFLLIAIALAGWLSLAKIWK